MKIIYDDETQTALDELDRNIENRYKYLAINFSFDWRDFGQDLVLKQLHNIKANLIATATVKAIEHDDQEIPHLGKGESFVDETDMYPVNMQKKTLLISTPSHAMHQLEQAFAASNVKAESLMCKQAAKVMGNFGNAVYNAGEAARVSAEELHRAMKKCVL